MFCILKLGWTGYFVDPRLSQILKEKALLSELMRMPW